jgi:hypothetical protein
MEKQAVLKAETARGGKKMKPILIVEDALLCHPSRQTMEGTNR